VELDGDLEAMAEDDSMPPGRIEEPSRSGRSEPISSCGGEVKRLARLAPSAMVHRNEPE
jgi:hypothetical protein